MSKKTELVEAILKLRKKENDIAESKHLYTLTNQQLEKIYNSERKRTEQEVLKDFEELGWKVVASGDMFVKLYNNGCIIRISTYSRWYSVFVEDSHLSNPIDMQEHKLLTELFTIWGWL